METNSSEPQKPKSSPLIALLLGFAPAAILIGFFTGLDRSISRVAQNQLLWFACVVSIACCCISSALLFRRRTSAAIGGAVLLMLLNAFIAFFFGCCASFNFH